jgi:hypothetical protein
VSLKGLRLIVILCKVVSSVNGFLRIVGGSYSGPATTTTNMFLFLLGLDFEGTKTRNPHKYRLEIYGPEFFTRKRFEASGADRKKNFYHLYMACGLPFVCACGCGKVCVPTVHKNGGVSFNGFQIDHIDGNKRNDRITNLRLLYSDHHIKGTKHSVAKTPSAHGVKSSIGKELLSWTTEELIKRINEANLIIAPEFERRLTLKQLKKAAKRMHKFQVKRFAKSFSEEQ